MMQNNTVLAIQQMIDHYQSLDFTVTLQSIGPDSPITDKCVSRMIQIDSENGYIEKFIFRLEEWVEIKSVIIYAICYTKAIQSDIVEQQYKNILC